MGNILKGCNCPICSSSISIVTTTIDKKALDREATIDEVNKSLIYRGCKFVMAYSIGQLCKLHGVPLGRDIGNVVTSAYEQGLAYVGSEIKAKITGEPRYVYLVEIKCQECDYVVKKYFTDKIE